MKSKLVLFIAILMSVAACKTVETPIVNTVNISAVESGKNYKISYILPRTAIRIKVKVRKKTYEKGRYQQYAQAFLKLNDVITEDKELWTISSVEFSSYPLPDTSKVYMFETKEMEDVVAFSLTKKGFLKSVYPSLQNDVRPYRKLRAKRQKSGKHKQYRSKCSGSKCAVNKQVGFKNVLLPPKVLKKQSLREQAAELSQIILSLREDRAAILVGDGYTENMPDGEALALMLKEIDVVHSQYLSMFAGKTTVEDFEYNFTYIPENGRKFSKAMLFRFSQEKGMVGNADMSGLPAMLEVEAYNTLSAYEKFKYKNMFLTKSRKKSNLGLNYNIAATAKLRLLYNDSCIAENQMVIPQMGIVDKLPAEYLNGNYTIDFYPNLGTLKSVKKRYKADKN